jgi:hypothetical protein
MLELSIFGVVDMSGLRGCLQSSVMVGPLAICAWQRCSLIV